MNLVSLEQLSAATFTAALQTSFRVWADNQPESELRLVEVTVPRLTITSGVNPRQFENFSLLFIGPADRVLPQQTYWFESARIGRFELFIVPVGCDQNGTQYQATFNRLVPAGGPAAAPAKIS